MIVLVTFIKRDEAWKGEFVVAKCPLFTLIACSPQYKTFRQAPHSMISYFTFGDDKLNFSSLIILTYLDTLS